MAFLVVVARQFWQEPDVSVTDQSIEKRDIGRSLQDQKLLEDHMPSVYQTFGAYAVAASNEQRSQFVADPIRVAPRMVRYFELNPLIRMNPESLAPRARDVLYLPEGNDAIEVVWTSDERVYETLFVRQDDEWRLDWEYFVRYSEHPFSLFLAGDGPSEAEFRLLVRERLAKERRHEPEMSLVFYSPVVGRPRETGLQSPEILLPRHDPMGRRLAAAFALLAKGERPLGSRISVEDSEDLVRVRVKLRRIETGEQRTFQIVDLPACHWYGVTASPGVEEKDEESDEP